MLVRRVAFAAFTAAALLSSALAGPSFAAGFGGVGGHGPDTKDHTPLLEQCSAYETLFKRAEADRPLSHKLVQAQRLYRDGVRHCNMEQTKATQGANELSEALQLIGAQPRLF